MADTTQKNQTSRKLKTVIIVLAVLLVLSIGALTARTIYQEYFADNGQTDVVTDNQLGENTSQGSDADKLPEFDPFTPSSTEPMDGEEQSEIDENKSASDDSVIDESTESNRGDTSNGSGSSDSDNNEDEAEPVSLSLYQGKPDDNARFEVANMFPGDAIVKNYCLKASHSADITVYFDATVTQETKNLAQALHIKITHLETESVLFEGVLSDMMSDEYSEVFAEAENGETIANYEIVVSMPTSAGNEYQGAMLVADFEWYVIDSSDLSPKTGDNAPVEIWITLMVASALAVLVLISIYRKYRKEDKHHG